jgi:hypothetical protein
MEETLSKSSATNPAFVHVILVFIIYELFYEPSSERIGHNRTHERFPGEPYHYHLDLSGKGTEYVIFFIPFGFSSLFVSFYSPTAINVTV